jgi:hypothetical protein
MRLYALGVAFVLAGCGLNNFSPNVGYEVIVHAVQDCDSPPAQSATPTTVMEVGFRQVKLACEAFFVDATIAQRNALAGNKGLDAGLLGATAILNATTSPAAAAKAITVTTAGVVLSKELMNQYTSIYTFDTHLYKVRQLVKGSMQQYAEAARSIPPANYCRAYDYVADLATLCSLASMQSFLDEQVAKPSEVVADLAGSTPVSTSRIQPRSRSLPVGYQLRSPPTSFRVQ